MLQLETPRSVSLAGTALGPTISRPILVTRILGASAALTGIIVLIGWILQIGILKSIFPAYATMKPLAAVSFLLLGLRLFLTPETASKAGSTWLQRFVRPACLFTVFALALMTLIEYVFGLNLGIDTALFSRATLGEADRYPGRMSLVTAFNFALLSGGLLFDVELRRRRHTAEAISFIVFLGGLIPLFGYLFDVSRLFAAFAPVSMALHTAILFMVLSAGVLFMRVDGGLMGVIFSAYAGGWMARRFLPLAIGLSVAAAWVRFLGQRAGFYGTEIGIALFLTANIVITTSLLWIVAGRLNRQDALHQNAEADRARLLVEKAQHISEDRFRSLFELSLDIIGIADFDGNFLLVNDSFTTVLGYTRKEFLSRPFMNYIHPDDIDKTTRAYESQLKRGEPVLFFKNRYLRKDGTAVSLEWSAKPDVSNATMFCIARDVTERERAEAEERKQAALLNLAHDAIIGTDIKRQVTFWSNGAEEIYGFTAEAAMGRVTDELLQTKFPTPLNEIEAVLLAEDRWEGELLHTRADQSRVTVASRWALDRDMNGNACGTLQINSDITRQKESESMLQLLTDRLSLAAAVAQVGVWDWDLTTNTLAWDATMFAIYGISPVVPMPYDRWAIAVLPEDLAGVEAILQRAIAEKGEGSAEFRIMLPDGSIRNITAVERVVLDEHGNVSRVFRHK
jgi:PAS domain S-box-containing protein